MVLIQILLPLYTNERQLFPDSFYEAIRETLTEQFGGVTAYQRSPALGHWKQTEAVTIRDDIVVFEVMAASLTADERAWWQAYREQLRIQFQQDKLIVRALPFELL
jgi:hypothetical protein